MKERPILMAGSMVRATLDGRKGQTRRVIRPNRGALTATHVARVPASDGRYWVEPGGWVTCPYGEPGDRLWVRETFGLLTGNGVRVVYRADAEQPPRIGYPDDPVIDMKWTPSIYMRRQHSRITLEVTSVRVERVADISDPDAEAEGIETSPNGHPAHIRFAELWDSINGKRPGCSWDANPFVWAVGFKVVR